MATARVRPAWRAQGIIVELGLTPYWMSKPAESLPERSSRVDCTAETSETVRFDDTAMKPGVTTPPLASITVAPAGA